MQSNEKIYAAFDWRFKKKLLVEDEMCLQKLLDKKLNIDDNISNSKYFKKFNLTYILNLQIASFENDASPSKPILYKIF